MAGSRPLYASLGLAATALAVLGVWLPVLPTTPFVLVALWAFSRSSERLTVWLRGIPLLRGAVAAADQYERDRSLPWHVKVLALTCAWVAVPLVYLVTRSAWVAAAGVAGAVGATIFMSRTATRPTGAVPSDS